MEVQHGPVNSEGTTGAYVLRDLINDIPLSADGEDEDVYITCVDVWEGNLYVGTSAGELLHFVSLPPPEGEEDGQPTWIIASRLQPPYSAVQEPPDVGVKQILILPEAGKACVLCNGTLTFYTLPELSPAYGGKIKQAGCTWIGGLDKNDEGIEDSTSGTGTVVIICLKQRLRLIRIGEDARKIRDIELGGVDAIQRRGDLACVTDGTSYSLLDVVNQRKIDLFPISSNVPELPPRSSSLEPGRSHVRQASQGLPSPSPSRTGRHARNDSIGRQSLDDRLRPGSASPWPARDSSKNVSSSGDVTERTQSPVKPAEDEEEAPVPPPKDEAAPKLVPQRPLPPNIASPTPNEFLLTTGTRLTEPGVGMFVNLEGDVVRGTIEFSTYPRSLVLDASSQSAPGMPSDSPLEGYVLALVQRTGSDGAHTAIEIQRWDAEPGEVHHTKHWLALPPGAATEESNGLGVGLRSATTSSELAVPEIGSSLRLRRLHLEANDEISSDEEKRDAEEDSFTARFTLTKANLMLHCGKKVQWLMRTALLTRLERRLDEAVTQDKKLLIDVVKVQTVVNDIRGLDAQNELDFLTLTYIRQKASILLFGNLLLSTRQGVIAYEKDKRAAGEVLVEGDLDPRTIVSLVSPLSAEVQEGPDGIWIPQGLRDTIMRLRNALGATEAVPDTRGPYGDNLLQVIKRYLLVWRKKKGFGSVADEANVFKTVDAALLHVLLLLDQHSPRGPASGGSIRAELNDVVDKGVDCFERAIELFERFDRLYMLSRLYQSRKMAGQVLSTWRRIVEGEHDAGGELLEGEQDIRRYVTKIRDEALVQEYGAWLANRNPKLGVQIFADDGSRIKFQPAEAVALLKQKAPGAVKDYLEYLVFGKNLVQYVNDLIAFYLDTILEELGSSEEAKGTLTQSYETYRALQPPKPTYRQFITDNAVEAEWWHNRLRLLQLIGGSHGVASKFNVHTLSERLTKYSDELVPEMIILNGREGKHEEALRLLTHGLGDYDTAIRYCLLGGSSIFHPGSNFMPEQALPSKEEQADLFKTLLSEFFRIEDGNERLERTSELLERFGGWFDIGEVLSLIPDDWGVDQVSGFLLHALRRLVREKNETVVVKALSSAQNLRNTVLTSDAIEKAGPVIVRDDGGEMQVS